MKHYRLWIVLGIIAAAIVVIGGVLIFQAAAWQQSIQCVDSQASLEERLDIVLPPSAENVQFHSVCYFGAAFWLRFDIAPGGELEAFLAAINLTPQAGVNPFPPSDTAVSWWWTPDQATTFAGGIGERYVGGEYFRQFPVLIQQDNPERWTVFLHVYDDL